MVVEAIESVEEGAALVGGEARAAEPCHDLRALHGGARRFRAGGFDLPPPVGERRHGRHSRRHRDSGDRDADDQLEQRHPAGGPRHEEPSAGTCGLYSRVATA